MDRSWLSEPVRETRGACKGGDSGKKRESKPKRRHLTHLLFAGWTLGAKLPGQKRRVVRGFAENSSEPRYCRPSARSTARGRSSRRVARLAPGRRVP